MVFIKLTFLLFQLIKIGKAKRELNVFCFLFVCISSPDLKIDFKNNLRIIRGHFKIPSNLKRNIYFLCSTNNMKPSEIYGKCLFLTLVMITMRYIYRFVSIYQYFAIQC